MPDVRTLDDVRFFRYLWAATPERFENTGRTPSDEPFQEAQMLFLFTLKIGQRYGKQKNTLA
jgi:hypothetical protein